MTGRLQGKVCLVTGGLQGIGKAIVKAFEAEGGTVIVGDINHDGGQALGGNFILLDVSDEAQWKRAGDYIKEQHGRLDVLVNNAGITGLGLPGAGPHDPEYCSLAEWRAVHQVNLDGTFLGCRMGIELMKEHGGSIINMSSRSGVVGIPGAAAYASSKAGVRNHTKTVALYCAEQKYNIRCNSIHPGAIMTPIWDDMLGPNREEALKALCEGIPLGRMGNPSEVAALCLLLASDEATYITGSEFTIDGGILAGSAASPKSSNQKG